MNEPIKPSDFVVYKHPTPDEIWNGEPLRFYVLEVDRERALIEAVTPSLSIRPTQRANVSELIKVEDLQD